MSSFHILGVFLAISSSVVYGSADFCGGVATRRSTQYQVLALSTLVGVATMGLLALVWGEGLSSAKALFWGGVGGICGVIGLAALYHGLARGHAAIVSPVSGVLGAAIPVLFAALTAGLPGVVQLAGFVIAIPGIWLVTLTAAATRERAHSDLRLGILAGIAFGLTFIAFARIGRETVFGPLAVAKAASFLVALGLLRSTRLGLPPLKGNLVAVLAGVLDPCANALFVLACSYTRLDVAVVLTSLYPAGTVLLSHWFFKEHISRMQWAGVALCVTSIALITFSPG